MAGEGATVEVDDEAVVTVDVTDIPGLEPEVDEAQPEPAPRQPATTQRERTPIKDVAAEAAASLLRAAEETAEAERRRADEATRLANQRAEEARGYKEQAESHELTIVKTGIENATREIETQKGELERAYEAGDFKLAAEAQVKLAKATSALDRLEESRANIESGARQTTEGRVEAPTQQVSAFEQYVSGFAPASQAWLRAHPECVPANVGGSATSNAKMMAGHYDAIAKNIQPNTPEYFKTIEEHTGHRAPVSAASQTVRAGEDEPAAPRPAAKPRQPMPAAPVSRDAPGADGVPRSTRSVTLTKDQQDAAKMSWPNKTPQEAFALYAQNLIALQAEGKMGRLTH